MILEYIVVKSKWCDIIGHYKPGYTWTEPYGDINKAFKFRNEYNTTYERSGCACRCEVKDMP